MQITKLPFANVTITLYNRRIGLDEAGKTFTSWHRTVIKNCSWKKQDKVISFGNAVIGSDDYAVQIPEDTDYVDYWQWCELPYSGLSTKFTVNIGDVVVKGIVQDEIACNGSPKELLQKYGNRAFTAKYAHNNTGEDVPLGHYGIGGK